VLTDEEAFLLSDAENEGRKDLSDYEKACDWADALECYYNHKVERLATAINKPRSAVYRYLELASMDARIVAAYDSPLDIKTDHASKLSKVMKSDVSCKKILSRADELSKTEGMKGSDVIKHLLKAGEPTTKKSEGSKVNKKVHMGEGGVMAFSLSKAPSKPLVIKFNHEEKLDMDALLILLRKSLIEHLD